MSTARKPRETSPDPRRKDRYFYGWRDVWEKGANGRKVLKRHALTEEDILYPREGDHVTQNTPHADDVIYLREVLTAQLEDTPDAQVFFDASVIWDVPDMGDHGPDIMVVFGIPRGHRDSFDVAREGARPELIIEVTSPSTRNNDLNTKPGHYWRARVPYYVIVDATQRRGQRQLEIIGYRRGARQYRSMRLNAQGRLWLEPVRLWLGQEEGRVACYDEHGQRQETTAEERKRRKAAEQLANQERQRAEAAEEQLRQMAAELKRLRGEE